MGRAILSNPPRQAPDDNVLSSSPQVTTPEAAERSEFRYPASRWPDPFNPWHKRNKDPRNPLNRQDHGFNHLNIQLPQCQEPVLDKPSPPKIEDDDTRMAYIDTSLQKLKLAKLFIEAPGDKEPVHKNPAALSLAEGPVAINFYTQQLIRLILETRCQLQELVDIGESDSNIQEVLQEYSVWWAQVRVCLLVQMPGESETLRTKQADQMMDQVLNKAFIEIYDEVEGREVESGGLDSAA